MGSHLGAQAYWAGCRVLACALLVSCGSPGVATAPVDQTRQLESCGPSCATNLSAYEAAYDGCVKDQARCAGHSLACEAWCAVAVGCTGALRGWTLQPGLKCPITCTSPDQTLCGSYCVLLAEDPANCGECGHGCAVGETCTGGTCVTPPAPPECAVDGKACGVGGTCCGGECVNAQNDAFHCGNACAVCGSEKACCGGTCTPTNTESDCGGCGAQCSAGDTCCSTGCANTARDVYNCGECGKICPVGALCCGGKCALGESATGCGCATNADCAKLDDGNFCNGVVTCLAGSCVLDTTSIVPCVPNPANPCQTAACNPVTGACEAAPKANGTACDDSDPCTKSDSCQAGACVGLELATMCQCLTDGDCNDGNACNGVETCKADAAGKTCQPGTPITCKADLAQPCVLPVCNAATGSCDSTPAALGLPCKVTGGPCGGAGTCAAGQCLSVAPQTCGECPAGFSCTGKP